MSYIVIVFVCLTGIHGKQCTPFQEPRIPHYATYQQCERKARSMADSIKHSDPKLWGIPIPGTEYHVEFKAFCLVPVIDEVVLG